MSSELEERLERVLREKSDWTATDEIPVELRRVFLEVKPETLSELAEFAKKSLRHSRLVALLVLELPDVAWPANDLALSLASRLEKDGPATGGLRHDAIRLLVGRDFSIAERLLARYVLGVPASRTESALLADLADLQRHFPEAFLNSLKKVALLPDDELVLSGLLFRGYANFAPEEDEELRAAIIRACSKFEDPTWILAGKEQRVLEILGDVPALSAVLLNRADFSRALSTICRLVSLRNWSAGVSGALVRPLVMWKEEVSDVAPWMELEYRLVLQQLSGTHLGAEAVALWKRIEGGYYRNLKRNPVIERQQLWRDRARARAVLGGQST